MEASALDFIQICELHVNYGLIWGSRKMLKKNINIVI